MTISLTCAWISTYMFMCVAAMLVLYFYKSTPVLFEKRWNQQRQPLPFSELLVLNSNRRKLCCYSVLQGLTFSEVIDYNDRVMSGNFMISRFLGNPTSSFVKWWWGNRLQGKFNSHLGVQDLSDGTVQFRGLYKFADNLRMKNDWLNIIHCTFWMSLTHGH